MTGGTLLGLVKPTVIERDPHISNTVCLDRHKGLHVRAGDKRQLFTEACIMEFSLSLVAGMLFQTFWSLLFVCDTH